MRLRSTPRRAAEVELNTMPDESPPAVPGSGAEESSRSRWTLLTSHGHVLFYIAAEPDATVRQITDATGISERRVISVLRDLQEANMVTATKVGNRRHYDVDPEAHFRHPTLRHVRLRDVLARLRVRNMTPAPPRWKR